MSAAEAFQGDSLVGRVAIVTGAADGPKAALGSVMAAALAQRGARVVLADTRDCASAVDRIVAAGGTAHGAFVDVTSYDSVQALVSEAVDQYGSVDILVNNAVLGSNIPPVALADLSVDAWDDVMAVNVRGPFLCAQAVAPHMSRSGHGKILNIGSATALEGLARRLHYVTSKGAVQAMTRALARELGPAGIRVNTLAPGLVMNPSVAASMAGRPGVLEGVVGARAIKSDVYADDLLGAALFLTSSASDAITGQMIVVDNGGWFL